jgi:GNAT superfamily N-acetyltransferase
MNASTPSSTERSPTSRAASCDATPVDLTLRELPYDHPVVTLLIEEVQQEYVVRYGDRDATPVEPSEFAPPRGTFVVAEVDGVPIGCAGLRSLEHDVVEIKRMFVRSPLRRKGYARQLLTELEGRARANGFRRIVLETGLAQPEALALYPSAGYEPVEPFGHYAGDPLSRCFGKGL